MTRRKPAPVTVRRVLGLNDLTPRMRAEVLKRAKGDHRRIRILSRGRVEITA